MLETATCTEPDAPVDTELNEFHAIGQELLQAIAPPPVVLRVPNPPDRYGKVTVEAHVEADDQLLHVDSLRLEDAKARDRFGKAVKKAAPALATAERIAQQLLEVDVPEAAEVPPLASPLEEDLSTSAILRPSGFITPTLAGLLALRLVRRLMNDGVAIPAVRFELIVAYSDGTRHRVPFSSSLEDHEGNTYYLIAPPPSTSPRTVRSGWSREGQEHWLKGATPTIADVRDRLSQVIAARVWFPPDLEEPLSLLVACFVILTYVADAVDVTAYLHVTGPKGSGKTQGVLVLFSELSFRPLAAADVSAPVIFRLLDALGGTLILDETEKLNGSSERAQDITGLLNAGHSKGFPARRCEKVGDEIVVREFDCYGPKVLASIAPLPDTLASRCIRLPMLRRPRDMQLPSCDIDLAQLRDDLHALTLTHAIELRELLRAEDDSGLSNRNRDLWLPLLRIAGWLDPGGALDLVKTLRTYAEASSAEVERESGVPEHDEVLLLVLYERVAAGTQVKTTAADLLMAARISHPRLFENWTPKKASCVLSRYGLKTERHRCGKEAKRTYAAVSLDRLRAVMDTYGVELPDAVLQPEARGE